MEKPPGPQLATCFCLTWLLGLHFTLASNIFPVPFSVIHGKGSQHFGHRVLQFRDQDSTWIIVGAPGEQNNTGRIYQCHPLDGSCEVVKDMEKVHTPHLGLTLEGDAATSRFIACSPGVPHECEKSTFLNGLCYIYENGRTIRELQPGYQECVRGKVDLVFLFDGSNSMTADNFKSIIDFMISVMQGLRNTTVQFAAVQFSKTVETVFTFNDFQRVKDPMLLFANVLHLQSLTFTFKAIHHVITQIFNSTSGNRPDAKKVIILITDGDANDAKIEYKPEPIPTANERGIIRYIIGVGNNFQGDGANYLKIFASSPAGDHIKMLDSFSKLQTVFNEIQKKLFAIEGSRNNTASFIMELSSGGFSAALSSDQAVLGAVGAHNWAGGLIELQANLTQENFINISSLSADMEYAYLGYSLKRIVLKDRVLYAAGAPRYHYVGKVVVFSVNNTSEAWAIKQNILGTQIGSYFGSELCTVDLDGDQETNILLIAAPLYHEDRRGGRVDVCHIIEDSISCSSVLRGEVGHPFARFGAAMAALADLNGDGLADVAIGAPLENEDSGAVYIFQGQKGGIGTHYSQRIVGSPGLKLFGQSLHGSMDLSGDKLTDITVGARGQVLILRSRPIVNVSTSMSFSPQEIKLKIFECLGKVKSQHATGSNISLCFNSSYITTAYTGRLSSNLTYRLELDTNRMKNRVVFKTGKRFIADTLLITEGQQCITEGIFLPNCIEDYFAAIKVSVNFSLAEEPDASESQTLSPILNPLYNATWFDEIPFEKNCGEDGICEADLRVTFDASGDQQLIVKEASLLHVILNLGNSGEDAYQTILNLTYPAGLSYRKVSVLKTTVSCDMQQEEDAPQGTTRSLICHIAHPVFKKDAQARLDFLFDVLRNSSWGDFVDITVSVRSDYENGTLLDNRALLHIPVVYAINVIGNRLESSTKYVNFTVGKQQVKSVKHSYKVLILEPISLLPPLTIRIAVPVNFSTGLRWAVENVSTDPRVPCRHLTEMDLAGLESCAVDIRTVLNHTGSMKVFQCDVKENEETEFHLDGQMSIPKEIETSTNLWVNSVLWIQYNTSRFTSIYIEEDFSIVQVTTQVEIIVQANYFYIILGSSVGGLFLLLIIIVILCKVGFFNRKYKEKMTDNCNGDANCEATEDKEEANEEKEVCEPLNEKAPKE